MIGLEPERVRRDLSPVVIRKTIASRDSGRRSFCRMRRNGGRPPPFQLEEAPRARSMSSVYTEPSVVCAPAGVVGNRESAASGRIPPRPRHRADRRGYTPGVPGSRRGGSDRGGPAIARSGRVVRPVRRPSDRQTNRRSSGGDPREICNQVPSQEARGLSILAAPPEALLDLPGSASFAAVSPDEPTGDGGRLGLISKVVASLVVSLAVPSAGGTPDVRAECALPSSRVPPAATTHPAACRGVLARSAWTGSHWSAA